MTIRVPDDEKWTRDRSPLAFLRMKMTRGTREHGASNDGHAGQQNSPDWDTQAGRIRPVRRIVSHMRWYPACTPSDMIRGRNTATCSPFLREDSCRK